MLLFMVYILELMLSFMVCILYLIWSRSDFDRDGEVGEIEGKIASDVFYVMELEHVLLEGFIVSNIY